MDCSLRELFCGRSRIAIDQMVKEKSNKRSNAAVAIINPADIGEAAAKLLALDKPPSHFGKKYNLSGREDVTGKDIVSILSEITHQKIQADYKDLTLFKILCERNGYPASVWESLEYGRRENLWKGLSGLANTPTSPELLLLAPPHSTVKEFIEQIFKK